MLSAITQGITIFRRKIVSILSFRGEAKRPSTMHSPQPALHYFSLFELTSLCGYLNSSYITKECGLEETLFRGLEMKWLLPTLSFMMR